MRKNLLTLVLDRVLLDAPPSEDFFSAGPPVATVTTTHLRQQAALLADIRDRRISLAA
ncbi:MAG: hypothetical protein H0W14_07295 [Actinobacteria bacterium]|nr:hypothetical protein [Actinomycetota bacterium]